MIYFKVFKAMRQKIQTGQEGMLGKKGLVVENIDPEGKIQYASEIWDARTKGDRFSKGEQVKINGIQGLMLLVEKIPAERGMIERRRNS